MTMSFLREYMVVAHRCGRAGYSFYSTPSNASLEMLHRGGWASQEEQQVLRAVKWTRIESEVHWDDKGIVGSAGE